MASTSSFGELVLVLGDAHLPERTSAIPAAFQRMLVPGRMKHVLCIGSPIIDDPVYQLAPNVIFTTGQQQVVTIGGFRIGLVPDVVLPLSNSIASLQRQLQVDVLITGRAHSPQVEIISKDGSSASFCHIQPGSITGAPSGYCNENETVEPSFVLLAVNGDSMVCYVYELNDTGNDVVVSKTEFSKSTSQDNSEKSKLLADLLLVQ